MGDDLNDINLDLCKLTDIHITTINSTYEGPKMANRFVFELLGITGNLFSLVHTSMEKRNGQMTGAG